MIVRVRLIKYMKIRYVMRVIIRYTEAPYNAKKS